MEFTVSTQFVIFSLHPDKGRIMMNNIHFRYSLTGAVLMDFLDNAEISLNKNRLVHSFRKNGDAVHNMIAEKIGKSSKPRRIFYWIRSLSRKNRVVFREIVNSLISKGILRHERRLFLNIFPYNRYFLTDRRIRTGIVDEIRDVILHDKPATTKQSMLIGLIKASHSSHLLAKENGERRMLWIKCREFRQNEEMGSEIDKAIREVQSAIITSVRAAMAAAHASH